MKKFFSAMLAVLLIAAFMLPGHAYAADESFRLYYTFDKPSYEIGDTVTVQLHLDRTDGSDDYNLYAFEDQILFDKLNLTYIDSSKNSKNAASFIISQNSVYYNGKYDILRVNYNSLGAKVPRAASLVLAELKFTATNAVAAGELVSSNSSVHTYPTATAPLDVQNGSYTIKSKVPMYTVSFSGGANATGSAPETFLLKEAPEGYTFSLPENSYALNNAQFKGWSDGKSTYQPGASYRMGKANVTFTAQWNLKHHLTFTGGTGAAGEAPVMEDRFANDKIALPTQNTLASGELAFGGWKTGSRVYQPGDLFTMPDEDVVFAAQWKKPGESSDSGAGSWVSPYSDVRQGDWYYSAVAFADGKGYMGSVGGGRFSPNGLMTRAMMATILYRMAGSPAVTAANPFTDVPAGQWYTNAVVWAASTGLVNGYGAGRFGPMNTLTRGQLIAVLWRNAGSPAPKNASVVSGFSDAAALGSWAAPAAAWAVENNILNGVGGKLLPNGSATRAQFAAIISRMEG